MGLHDQKLICPKMDIWGLENRGNWPLVSLSSQKPQKRKRPICSCSPVWEQEPESSQENAGSSLCLNIEERTVWCPWVTIEKLYLLEKGQVCVSVRISLLLLLPFHLGPSLWEGAAHIQGGSSLLSLLTRMLIFSGITSLYMPRSILGTLKSSHVDNQN